VSTLADIVRRACPGHDAVAGDWRDELASVEGLLEKRPEIPIAFLGPTQQGKSSLINALLGENILAVGGAVGACTCVITSAHYRRGPGFRAEIDFISPDDWRAELEGIEEALADEMTEDDTDVDRDERAQGQAAAREKFAAVYRKEAAGGIGEALSARQFGLPTEIFQPIVSGSPVFISED